MALRVGARGACVHGGQALTRVLMFLALSAYSRVLLDSSKDVLAGLMWAIITVRLFPPSASCSAGARAGVAGTGPPAQCAVCPPPRQARGPRPEAPAPNPEGAADAGPRGQARG